MTPTIDRLVRSLERELITRNEFFYAMLEALGHLPAGERQAVLGTLAGHSSERVREAVVLVQAYVRNQALSRDFEYVQRNSPLRPGCGLELLADKYYYLTDNRPAWLGGRECCRATFIRFEPLRENLTPVALVELDEAIDLPGHQGRYGVLFARYGCDSAAWSLREDSVALCVVAALPSDLEGFNDTHPFTERQAWYRVRATAEEAAGSKD